MRVGDTDWPAASVSVDSMRISLRHPDAGRAGQSAPARRPNTAVGQLARLAGTVPNSSLAPLLQRAKGSTPHPCASWPLIAPVQRSPDGQPLHDIASVVDDTMHHEQRHAVAEPPSPTPPPRPSAKPAEIPVVIPALPALAPPATPVTLAVAAGGATTVNDPLGDWSTWTVSASATATLPGLTSLTLVHPVLGISVRLLGTHVDGDRRQQLWSERTDEVLSGDASPTDLPGQTQRNQSAGTALDAIGSLVAGIRLQDTPGPQGGSAFLELTGGPLLGLRTDGRFRLGAGACVHAGIQFEDVVVRVGGCGLLETPAQDGVTGIVEGGPGTTVR